MGLGNVYLKLGTICQEISDIRKCLTAIFTHDKILWIPKN